LEEEKSVVIIFPIETHDLKEIKTLVCKWLMS